MNVFYPNSSFVLEGYNLHLAKEIIWGDIRINKSSFTKLEEGKVYGTVPVNAISSKVYISDGEGNITYLGFKYVGLKEDSKISITGDTDIRSFGGETITITGENFYRIDEVTIAGIKVPYEVINKNIINIHPDKHGLSGPIQVRTFSRAKEISGYEVVGNLGFNYSMAESSYDFVYYPNITSLSSRSLSYGEELSIFGSNLHTVESVSLGKVSYLTPSLVSQNEVKVSIPLGDTEGYINLKEADSNITYDNNYLFYFSPSLLITSLSLAEGYSGLELSIYAQNLSSDTLFVNEENLALVNIGGIDVFFEIESDSLRGVIPEGLNIGLTEVFVYSKNQQLYDSKAEFNNLGGFPELNSVDLKTVIVGDTLEFSGSNFQNIEKIILYLNDQSVEILPENIDANTQGTLLSFVLPEDFWLHSDGQSNNGFVGVKIITAVGESEIFENSFYLVGKPRIDSVGDGSKLIPNSEINVSGLNINVNNTVKIYDSNFSFLGESKFIKNNIFRLDLSFSDPNVYIKVEGPAGESDFSDLLEVHTVPIINSFSPSRGFVGEKITMLGEFDGFTDLHINGESIDISSESDIENGIIIFNYPMSPSAVITVQTLGGFVISEDQFIVLKRKPELTSLYPDSFIRGQAAELVGTSLHRVKSVILRDEFGLEYPLNNFSKNYDKIKFTVPLSVHSEASNTITVIDEDDNSINASFGYDILMDITGLGGGNSNFVDNNCKIVNNLVTGQVLGRGFLSAKEVYFSLDGVQETSIIENFEVISDNLINFTSPFSGSYYDGNSYDCENDESGVSGEGGVSGENTTNEEQQDLCGHIIVRSETKTAVSDQTESKVAALKDFEICSFSPKGGDETSVIDIKGIGFLDVQDVLIGDTSAPFSIIDNERILCTIPEKSLQEGQDLSVALKAFNAFVTVKDEEGNDDKFELISSVSAVNFKVLAENPPESAFSSSSLFSVIEVDSNGEWYVTKITNPDGSETVISSVLIE